VSGGQADNKVWAENLEAEFAALRQAIEQYPYVSMVSATSLPPLEYHPSLFVSSVSEFCWTLTDQQDTEFPGIVARPIGSFKTGADYHYQTMRCNVDMLKMIQLGVTVSDENGNCPELSTWQFNFTFDLS
jgi:CCR4-NOT transcription complex subunit 7/8